MVSDIFIHWITVTLASRQYVSNPVLSCIHGWYDLDDPLTLLRCDYVSRITDPGHLSSTTAVHVLLGVGVMQDIPTQRRRGGGRRRPPRGHGSQGHEGYQDDTIQASPDTPPAGKYSALTLRENQRHWKPNEEKTKNLVSTSIRYRSDVKVLDRCLFYVDLNALLSESCLSPKNANYVVTGVTTGSQKLWQPAVQPATKKLASWQRSVLGEIDQRVADLLTSLDRSYVQQINVIYFYIVRYDQCDQYQHGGCCWPGAYIMPGQLKPFMMTLMHISDLIHYIMQTLGRVHDRPGISCKSQLLIQFVL